MASTSIGPKAYQEGYAIGSKNSYYGKRNILVIDDRKTVFPATDKETGLPIIVLTDAKNTKDLQDLVCGYNRAMHRTQGKHQKTEQISDGKTPEALKPPH